MTVALSRRSFVVLAGGAGAGLVLGVRVGRAASPESAALGDWAPNAFVRIDSAGVVTVLVAKAEMGQGVFTALPMIVAEELDADWSAVRIEQSPAKEPYNTATGGSDSVADNWTPLRQAGAAARSMLVSAAAAEWGVPPSECRTEAGAVIHASGKRLSYGALAARAATLPLPDVASLALKSPAAYRIVGRSTARRDARAKTDGSAMFGLDVRVPGMLVASVARCPVYDGTIARVDDAMARAMPGVSRVIRFDALRQYGLPARVAVVAKDTWTAMKARRALVVEWNGGANAEWTSAAMLAQARAAVQRDGDVFINEGDVARARAGAARVIEQTYETPLVAHLTMEPMNCTARVTDTSAELWMPSQSAAEMRLRVARFLNLPPDSVVIHQTFLGGGFGRRFYPDFVIDAVQIAKAVGQGVPVQVVWSREEDLQHDFYRPASVQRMRAGLDASGKPVSWENRVAGPSSNGYWRPNEPRPGQSDAPEAISYAIANRFADFVYVPAPVPLGAWRAVRHNQNIFAIESFMDELARANDADPIAYRLSLLQEPRARHVLEVVRDKADWARPLPAGRGRGVAFVRYAGTYVAHVAEVSVTPDGVRVERIVCAFDCGQTINPDTVKAQVEGSAIWALSAALWGEVTVEHGRTVQSNFNDYRVARMRDAPAIDVHLVENHEKPTGVGETSVPGVSPAIANAVFAATGKRVRRLPIATNLT